MDKDLLLASLLEQLCLQLNKKEIYNTLCNTLTENNIINNPNYFNLENKNKRNNIINKLINFINNEENINVNKKSLIFDIDDNNNLNNESVNFLNKKIDINYDSFKLIGYGGFGKVYQVNHKIDGMVYAIKKIKLNLDKLDNNIFKEVKVLARLNHKNIIRYYNAWIEYSNNENNEDELLDYDSSFSLENTQNSTNNDNKEIASNLSLYIQMELCELTLYDYIKQKGKLNKNNIDKIMGGLINGIEYLHSNGIIHRDIKPQNIFLHL